MLSFPRDHGAHPQRRLEWWYATGWLQGPDREPRLGWQITFFRLRTGLDGLGRFAPRQLLIAHAAVSDLVARRHHRAQRVGRWSGDDDQPEAHARRDDTDIVLGAWSLLRGNARHSAGQPVPPDAPYRARLAAPDSGFALDLRLQPTQPVLLQGHQGYSRKGPDPRHASHYYTQPQLAAQANVRLTGQASGRTMDLNGRGWLDHEWSDALMPPGAVGWDWIGINLHDGGALTAFVMRDRDDRPLWAAGSHRPAGEPVRAWSAEDVRFTPLGVLRERANYFLRLRPDGFRPSRTVSARSEAHAERSFRGHPARFPSAIGSRRTLRSDRSGLAFLCRLASVSYGVAPRTRSDWLVQGPVEYGKMPYPRPRRQTCRWLRDSI